MHVAVHPAESSDDCETFARVFADNQRAVGLEHAIWIFRIDNEIRKIEWPPHHPLAFVALVPRHPAVVGTEQRAVRRFDESVNAFGVRRRDRHCKPAIRFLRETFVGLRRNFRPCVAAIRGTKQSAGRRRGGTFPAGAVLPPFAPEIPHVCKHDVGIGRIHRDVGATGRKIRALENLLPSLAAIGCFVEATVRRITPKRAGHSNEDSVAASRINDDPRNALRFFQTNVRPRFAAIG